MKNFKFEINASNLLALRNEFTGASYDADFSENFELAELYMNCAKHLNILAHYLNAH